MVCYETLYLTSLDVDKALEIVDDPNTPSDSRFDVGEGLYWFCVDHYSGMGDPLYRVQCELGYKPGPCSNGPESEGSQWVYELLTRSL